MLVKYMQLGKSGITVSKLGLGTWAIGGDNAWGTNDDSESIAAIHEALDLGFNMLDTAPAYGMGHCEEVVGKALKGRRDNVIISTKCGLVWHEGSTGSPHLFRDSTQIYRNLTPKSIREELERSLTRLGTDYIDIYITHWQSRSDFPVAVSETMGCLLDLKKEGKIRAIGASNTDASIIKEYLDVGQLDLIQERYTMLDRRIEPLFDLCSRNKVAIMAYSPLEQGLLSGKYPRDYQTPETSIRRGRVWFQPQNLPRAVDMMEKWNPLCEKYKCTKTQLAIAWTACQSEFLQVLCGARRVEHVRDNAPGGDIVISPEDAAFMRGLAEELIPQ